MREPERIFQRAQATADFLKTFRELRFTFAIDIAAAALQELAKAGIPADNVMSSRPRVNAATQYLSEDARTRADFPACTGYGGFS